MALTTKTKAPNQETECGTCGARVAFYRFGGMAQMYPHFYCDTCSNLFFSRAHHDLARRLPQDASLLERLADSLPSCPCGGRFRPGTNPKCPSCEAELKHRLDPVSRLSDPFAVLLAGASLCSMGDEDAV